ncbi:MAG: hypothetical protein QXS20_04375 [Candidatus Thorarchaeota archaeon]
METTKTCSIEGCNKPSKRTFATSRIADTISRSGLRLRDVRTRRTYLCADHYKQVKKNIKEDLKPERLRWGH